LQTSHDTCLAQAAFVLAFVAALQFLLHFAPEVAKKWDANPDAGVGIPTATCVALTAAGTILGILASYRIVRNRAELKGLGLSLTAIAACVGLWLWMFSTLNALSRHKAERGRIEQSEDIPAARSAAASKKPSR
jgi:multisubunit Na+/H+ antiporter MnhB subunit